MLKTLNLELDSDLVKEAEELFQYVGLDMQSAVKMFLTRVTQEKTIAFLFRFREAVEDVPIEKKNSKDNAVTDNSGKITKKMAVRLFLKNGNVIYPSVTFASKNRSAYNYWANPNFDLLKKNWSLILNDNIEHRLYLFSIPAGSINESDLRPRADIPDLVDLQICYRDKTFMDNRSGFSFLPYLTAELRY